MSGSDRDLEVDKVAKAIQGVIAHAALDGRCVQPDRSASMIAKFYPNCGETTAEIAERITMAAIYALVPVELTQPKPERNRGS
jgi:hypothetical protein